MTHNPRVPVLSPQGDPLMPTKASRARKWIESNKAKPRLTKEGVFYVQLIDAPSEDEKQDMALAVDPGSKFDGYCVSGKKEVVLTGMAILPKSVAGKMESRKALRRNRRSRKCRRRESRFNNRKRAEGWICPSQLAKVQLRTRLMERLCRIMPISDIVIEDVRFNHYQKRWGKYFSTVEIGKTCVYEKARSLAELWLIEGWQTADTRKTYEIKKSSQKAKLSKESHANDALAMVCWLYGDMPIDSIAFYVWRRQEPHKRQLHRQEFSKNGIRHRHGGTTCSGCSLRKGDIVSYKDSIIGHVGGWTGEGRRITLVDDGGNRICNPVTKKVDLLCRSPNILSAIRF